MYKYIQYLILILFVYSPVIAQEDRSYLFGSFESSNNIFLKDEDIGAAGTPQYERQRYGTDTWLSLNYYRWGFEIGLRYDLFLHSYLLNPNGSYTEHGVGRWFIRKSIHDLDLSAGYLYDQIGAGLIFRAYEERPLAIDNAVQGARAVYHFNDFWSVKGLAGRQKRQFSFYEGVVGALNLNGFVNLSTDKNISIAPGGGFVYRHNSNQDIDRLVAILRTYTPQDSIGARYNTYTGTIYNRLNAGPFSWYIEAAYKSGETFYNPQAEKVNFDGSITRGKYIYDEGSVLYTTLTYAKSGLGISFEAKRTENFGFYISPFATGNQGVINFLPPMTRENTYRLTTRYAAATQYLGELSFQTDVRYRFSKTLDGAVTFSTISTLEDDLLYREFYTVATYKKPQKYQIKGGFQLQAYNQEVFEVKPQKGLIQALVPFTEVLYKLSRRKALRGELQYMFTDIKWADSDAKINRDYGDWIFLLLEYSIAPQWIFTVSDMYNIDPVNVDDPDAPADDIHYYSAGVVYNHKSNRFGLSFVKQVEGIVCSGGICRYEPAFNGFKLNITSTF